MIRVAPRKFTLQEFLELPQGEPCQELMNGEALSKVSPKRFHCGIQKALLFLQPIVVIAFSPIRYSQT